MLFEHQSTLERGCSLPPAPSFSNVDVSQVAHALARNGQPAPRVARDAAAAVAMPAVIAGVVAAGLSGAADAEGAVASRLPQQFAYLLRDSRAAWRQFTYFEAAAGFVALAARDASRTGDDLWTSCRRLLGRWRDAGRDLRRSVRRGRVDLDIYAAADGADADAPLVLIVPGGAWAHGARPARRSCATPICARLVAASSRTVR